MWHFTDRRTAKKCEESQLASRTKFAAPQKNLNLNVYEDAEHRSAAFKILKELIARGQKKGQNILEEIPESVQGPILQPEASINSLKT